MRQLVSMILVFSLSVPNGIVWAADTEPTNTPQPAAAEPTVSFANSLFKATAANKISPRGRKKDDSAFFCKDSQEVVSSFDPEVVLSLYLFFFKNGSSKSSNVNTEICAIYYRERYARILFEVWTDNEKSEITAKNLKERYLQQLSLLKKINIGSYTLFGKTMRSDDIDRKAFRELVSVIQEYWLTRFITYAYLERSREFALNGVGGVALSLGTVAGIVYFAAPKWADLATKVPRMLGQLGMLVRPIATTSGSIGTGLGASFAAASGMPDQYDVEVWPSPLEILEMPKDQVTIDTENVQKDFLLKEAFGIGGSVVAGYVGWHMVELAAEKAAGTRFVQLLLEGAKHSGGITKQVFVQAISALELTSATEKAIVVMNAIRNSELMASLVAGYKYLHGTSTIGSLIITDVLIHYLKEWIRETSKEELHDSYLESQTRFKNAVERFKADPNNPELSALVFTSAQKMFESMRLLVSHLLIPAYESVMQFSEAYRGEQTVPMTCNIAKMNVGPTNEKRVQKFLDGLQKNQRDNYLLAADSIDQFESTIESTELYFFTNFFKRKLSLLKISFFFDEKFGLETKQLSVGKNLSEFGKGYVRVLQGELAVNLQRIGSRLREGIESAKQDLGPNASPDAILGYFNGKGQDSLNYTLYETCSKLEKLNAATNSQSDETSDGGFSLKRWYLEK